MAKGIDLRDAAQQTRISLQYLTALEQEDFTKLPGEVFVKGFLKNYSRFLSLDETEVMKKYADLKPREAAPSPTAASSPVTAPVSAEEEGRKGTPVEPFIWGAIIVILLLVFIFAYPPEKTSKETHRQAGAPAVFSQETASIAAPKPAKIYLDVVANEDTWILVRTDDSPQKKAILKKGERLTWSADDRFVLSYGRIAAIQLLMSGVTLTVNGTKETVVRDLIVNRSGIVNQPAPAKPAKPMKPKPKTQPAAPVQQAQPQAAQPQAGATASPAAQPSPAPSQPAQAEPAPTPAPPAKPAE